MKLSWKYIQGDIVWAKWMKSKYSKSASFWTVTINNIDSYIWKSILIARHFCNGLIDRKIVNGESTNIWFDPWINGSSLIDNFGWNSMSVLRGCSKKISMLISDHEWKQHIPHIPTQMHSVIHNITIHNQMQKYFWCWLPNSNGQFSLKSA